jgi:hypothetical protein
MRDAIPAGFMTLPEAVQRIRNFVSNSQLDAANNDLQERFRAFREYMQKAKVEASSRDPANQQATESNTPALTNPRDCEDTSGQAPHWNKHTFPVHKLYSALQTGAIEGMVRDPDSGSWFRLTPSDWHFEPFWENIICGGVIRGSTGSGLERHGGRTVLIEIDHFDSWLRSERESWPQASREDLARNWLADKMRASPEEKTQTKARWFAEAKKKFEVSEREFNRSWSHAIKGSGSNWNGPGAPKKSLR